jgi:hypothetical protein
VQIFFCTICCICVSGIHHPFQVDCSS